MLICIFLVKVLLFGSLAREKGGAEVAKKNSRSLARISGLKIYHHYRLIPSKLMNGFPPDGTFYGDVYSPPESEDGN